MQTGSRVAVAILRWRARLALEELGTTDVLTVWADGSLSVHGYAFWGHRRPNGTVRRPLATFVRSVEVPSQGEIVAKLREGLARQGPATEADTPGRSGHEG